MDITNHNLVLSPLEPPTSSPSTYAYFRHRQINAIISWPRRLCSSFSMLCSNQDLNKQLRLKPCTCRQRLYDDGRNTERHQRRSFGTER